MNALPETSAWPTDRRYTAPGFGNALWVAGWVQRWEPATCLAVDPDDGEEYEMDDPDGDGEWVDDVEGGRVRVVMVGDDHRYVVDASDLVEIDDDAYCRECGSIGCAHGR